MQPVALALVPRDDQERAEALVPSLITEASLGIPLWFVTVVDGYHAQDAIRQIGRVHRLDMIVSFGVDLPSWPDVRNIGSLLVEGQVCPVRLVRLPPFRTYGLWQRNDAPKIAGANLRQAMLVPLDSYALNLGISEN